MRILPQRRSIRLKNYDYALPGYYYIAICTQNRECLFGDIIVGVGRDQPVKKMIFNDIGRMINQWWLKISRRFKNVTLDEYQIMPNHLHGIIVIRNGQNGQTRGFAPTGFDGRTRGFAHTVGISPVGVDQCVDPNPSLGKIIQWFKTMTTNHYIHGVKNNGWKPFDKRLWQRNYWEHVIRTETDLNKIREYIKNNPQMWGRDRNNPKNWGFSSSLIVLL